MQKTASNNRIVIRRAVFVAACFVVILLLGMGGMLFYVQIVQHDFYESRALAQQTMDKIVTPARGTIYTRNMEKLAYSVNCYTVVLAPKNMKEDQKERVASRLSEILDVDREWILERTARSNSYYEVIKRKVDNDLVEQIRTFISEEKIKGIDLLEDTRRYYPFGSLAANVVGFTTVDNNGAYGLEASYDDVLSGSPGRIITARNGAGTALSSSYEQYYDAQNGLSPVSTIDLTIQQILEKNLKQAYEDNKCAVGTVGLIMHVKTGEILGMAQYPSYDLNDPRTVWSEAAKAEIEALATEEERSAATQQALFDQWSIRPVTMTYEPGSVFKLVTASIALEEKVVSLNTSFTCPGYKIVNGTRVACWKHGGHGAESFLEGLKNSCNPVFMETALRIGTDTYYEYLHTTGIASKTGIDLQGEQNSILHSEESFRELEVAIAGFGQRFKVTPIRLLTTVCGLANGGKMMKPHLVRAYADEDGNVVSTVEPEMLAQIISASTSETMRYMMEQVVATGTGRNAYVAGYRVGGKTGTSEKLDVELKEGETEADKRIASFCAVAPMDDPEIAVLILLDEPRGTLRQGGQIAGPVAGRVMTEVLPYWGVEPVYSESELASAHVEVPNLMNNITETAKSRVTKAGFKVKVVGSGGKVTAQLPAPGAKIPKNSTVVIYCGESVTDEEVSMPSLIGMTYDQARLKLDGAGLYLEASGALQTSDSSASKAVSQSVAAGSRVTVGTVISVQFADMINTADQ